MTERRGVVSHRASGLRPSELIDILSAAQGPGIIDLAGGRPGTPEPDPRLLAAAGATIRGGDNQYGHPDGDVELRRAVAASLRNPPNDPVTEVTITVGASEALGLSVLAAVDPGDEVLLVEPYYENFLTAVLTAGGVPRFVPTFSAEGWYVDPARLREAVTPRTRAIMVNSPSNPSGHVLSHEELAGISRLAQERDLVVISDEVYSEYVYDGREHVSVGSVPGLEDRSVCIGSFSKSHALSGWRIGWARASTELTAAMRLFRVATSTGTSAPLQRALAEHGVAVPPDVVDTMRVRRDEALSFATDLGLAAEAPEGGCYLFADVAARSASGRELMHELLGSKILVAPATAFFSAHHPEAERFVRIAFNKNGSTLRAARDVARVPESARPI